MGEKPESFTGLTLALYEGGTEGKILNKPLRKSPESVVVAINSHNSATEPPEGWSLRSSFGMLRSDATPEGRLGRLADVVLWLMDKREMPCGVAVALVCDALVLEATKSSLYLLDSAGYAKPLQETDYFGFECINLDMWAYKPERKKEDEGVAGAVKYMRNCWGESSSPGATIFIGQEVLDPLAISLGKAFELWGYGKRCEPEVAVPVVPGPQMKTVISWTPVLRAELLADFNAAKGKNFTVRRENLFEKWKKGPDNLRTQIDIARREVEESQAGPFFAGLQKVTR